MPSRPAADVANALIAKGMERTESHHVMLRKTVNGVTQLVTRVSQGRGGEIGDGLAKMMANQCCLQLAEFWRLVECTLTEEEWDALVTERCVAGRNPFLR